MSDTMKKFKRMMHLAKENQKRFEKELKRLDWEDETSNHGEFEPGELFSKDEDLTSDIDSVIESNRQNIHELNKLRESSPNSDVGYLCDIARSLREISKSLSNIEQHFTNESEADWND